MFIDYYSIVEIMGGSTWPSSCIYSCGGSLVVISLTDICLIPVSLIPKDKSKINWNRRLFCVMSTTGEIFRFGGILILISFHLMTVVKPYWTFSYVSFMILVTALLVFSEMWVPWLSDSRMFGTVQFLGAVYRTYPFGKAFQYFTWRVK